MLQWWKWFTRQFQKLSPCDNAGSNPDMGTQKF